MDISAIAPLPTNDVQVFLMQTSDFEESYWKVIAGNPFFREMKSYGDVFCK